jgi:hypothetical protein
VRLSAACAHTLVTLYGNATLFAQQSNPETPCSVVSYGCCNQGMSGRGGMTNEGTETRTLVERVDDSALEYAWVSTSGQRAIAFDDRTIGMFELEGTRVERWESVRSLLPTRDKVSVELMDGTRFEFAFANKSDADQFPKLLPKGWKTKVGTRPTSAATSRSPGAASAVRHDPMQRSIASDARDVLRSLFGFGLVGQLIGGIVLGAALANSISVGLIIGWLLIAVGSMATFVALIGFGVRLGV